MTELDRSEELHVRLGEKHDPLSGIIFNFFQGKEKVPQRVMVIPRPNGRIIIRPIQPLSVDLDSLIQIIAEKGNINKDSIDITVRGA